MRTTKKPIIVASLPVRRVEDIEIIEEIDEVDLVELRLDYLEKPLSIDPELLLPFKEKIIITIREVSEGGIKRVDEEEKVKYFKGLNELGIMYDVETSILAKYDVPYRGKIVSAHYIDKLPSKSEVMSLASKYCGEAFSVKIAVKAIRGYKELLSSLLELGYDNISVMPLGSEPLERIAFTILGSKLLYGYITEPTAPGQMHYKRLLKILKCISSCS